MKGVDKNVELNVFLLLRKLYVFAICPQPGEGWGCRDWGTPPGPGYEGWGASMMWKFPEFFWKFPNNISKGSSEFHNNIVKK